MADTAARLQGVHAELERCVKEGCTFSSLDGPQHELDAIDASRYHGEAGGLPDMQYSEEIDACYGREEGEAHWVNGRRAAGARGPAAGSPPLKSVKMMRRHFTWRCRDRRRLRRRAGQKSAPRHPTTRPSSDLLAAALDAASDIDAKLVPTLKQLRGIRKALARLAHAKKGHTFDDIAHYQQMLDAIGLWRRWVCWRGVRSARLVLFCSAHQTLSPPLDSSRVDGIFGGDKAHIPAGQAQLVDTLAAAYEAVGALQETATDSSGRVAEVVAALAKHVAHLKALLEEDDTTRAGFEMKRVQGHLQELDSERLASTPAGWGVKGGVVPPGQAAAQGLLEEAFELVQALHDKGA